MENPAERVNLLPPESAGGNSGRKISESESEESEEFCDIDLKHSVENLPQEYYALRSHEGDRKRSALSNIITRPLNPHQTVELESLNPPPRIMDQLDELFRKSSKSSLQLSLNHNTNSTKNSKLFLSFPLHLAAEYGNVDELTKLLNEGKSPLQKDFKGRTPLHYAVCYGNQKIALKTSTLLLNSGQILDKQSRADFLNIQDLLGETALHLAAKAGHRKIAQLFLFSSADVNLKSVEGKEPLDLIYQHVPQAMCAIFDTAITYVSKTSSEDKKDEDDNAEIFLDFGAIMGYDTDTDKADKDADCSYKPESALLAYSLKESMGKCKEILVHPLVQLFLHVKWKKIRIIFWTSILLHILWSMLCSAFLASLYLRHCPYIPSVNVNGSRDEEAQLQNETEIAWEISVHCDIKDSWVTLWGILALGMTLLIFIKEVYECVTVFKSYFYKLENIGQILFIVCLLLSSLPVFEWWFGNSERIKILPWHYQSAAFAIFLAWALILGQFGKTPRLGIYVEILSKVLKSFVLFMLTFISLLTAFALSFSILMPQHPAFQSWPLAMCKVLMMMTGELEYEQFFYDQQEENGREMAFMVTGHIIFVTFTIIVTIILFNLLIGLTVSDIQGLQQDAKISGLAGSLERINLMEVFLQRFTSFFHINGSNLGLYVGQLNEEDDLGMKISMKKIPKSLQNEVKERAMSNALGGGGEGEAGGLLRPFTTTAVDWDGNDVTLPPAPTTTTDVDSSPPKKCGCDCDHTELIQKVVREVLLHQKKEAKIAKMMSSDSSVSNSS